MPGQASLSGSTVLPGNTSASLALSLSELRQDEALLPTSTLPGATVPGNFDICWNCFTIRIEFYFTFIFMQIF